MIRERTLLLIFVAQCFLVPILCTKTKNEEEILKQSLPAYAVISGAKHLNSTRCRKELEELREAIDRRYLWSLKVLDSSGNPEPGFLYGNNYWMGFRSQCEDLQNRRPFVLMKETILNNSRYRDGKTEFPPFGLNFFVAHMRQNSTLQYHVMLPNEDLVSLGLCLPDSCTTNELATIFESIFKNRTLLFNDLYYADFSLLEVKDLKDDHRWLVNGTVIIIGLIFLVTFLLMAVGTTYDILILRRIKKKHEKFHNCENNNMSLQLSTKPDEDLGNQEMNLMSQSVLGQAVQAFSIYTNTKIIFNTKLSADSVPAIHGLRFLGMMWIIMVHTLFYMGDFADNKPISWRKSEGLPNQVISNATLSVDTFFCLSGFLLSYMYFITKETKEARRPSNYRDQLKNVVLAFVKRFLRLTPAYMMALGVFQINSTWYQKTSLFYMTERGDEVCHKYWWRNILYIQNLFSRENMCMSWSWYLANDMQFFIIGTLLLSLSQMHFNIVVAVLGLLLVGSTILTGYISYIYEYVPTLDQQYSLLNVVYDPPWVRIGPYIVGVVTGYIILKLDKKLRLKRRTVAMLWIFGSACNIVVLFGLVDKQISVIASAFYNALSRTVWGIGIAWIIIACYTNNGGVVNKILSFRGWIPLSRLTYCAYLLNPILIYAVYLYGETSMHINFLRNGVTFLGNFVISYVCAYIFTLMFETPYVLLMKQLLSHIYRKK